MKGPSQLKRRWKECREHLRTRRTQLPRVFERRGYLRPDPELRPATGSTAMELQATYGNTASGRILIHTPVGSAEGGP